MAQSFKIIARSIARNKWETREGLATGEVPAYAVTNDLRADVKNTLSFWSCKESELPRADDAILAIAAGRDRLDKVELIILRAERLSAAGVALEPCTGVTPVPDLRERHIDAVRLDHVRVGIIAQHIAAALADDEHVLLTKKQVNELISRAISSGRVKRGDLDPKLSKAIIPAEEPGQA